MQDNCQKYSDIQLVEKSLEDSSFFECILQNYESKLLNYIKRLGKIDHATAEDILQEVFLNVYKNLNAYQPQYSFSSWIYRITHNQTINYFRKIKVRPQIQNFTTKETDLIWNSLSANTDIKKEYVQKELSQKINLLLQKLPEKYQEVLVLFYLEEKNYQEICDILQKPVGTVSTLLNRAKKKFRTVVEQEEFNI